MLSIASCLLSRRLPQLLTTMRKSSVEAFKVNSGQNIQNSIDQRLTRIDAYVRRTGRVTRKDVDLILKDLSSKSCTPTTTQSLLMIRCCGALLSEETPKARNLLVQQIFETLSNTTKLDISHYNSLLQVYLDNNHDFNPMDISSEIQAKGIEPNRVTYQRLIHRFCQMGDISGATKILEFMKSKELPVNESVFNSLILGYGRAGDLPSALETIDIMKSSGLEPSAETYSALLCAYASDVKNPESVEKIIQLIDEANSNEIVLSDCDLLQVIKAIALVDSESKLIDELMSRLNKAFGYNQDCMTTVYELVNLNKLNVAFKLYDTMKPPAQQIENKSVGIPLIRHLVRANVEPDVVLDFCEKLKSTGFNERGVIYAVESALINGSRDVARAYLKRLGSQGPLRVHYFWPILVKCQNEDEIFQVLSEDMASLSGADYFSLHDTFAHYVWPKQIIDTDIFMEKCKAIGFSFTLTYNALISYYLENNRIEDVAKLIASQKYSTVRLQSRILLQNLAEAFVNNPDVTNIVKILQEIVRNPERNSSSSESQYTDTCGRFLLQVIYAKNNISEDLLNQLLINIEKVGLKISNNCANAIRDRIQLSKKSDDLLSRIAVDDLGDAPYYDADDITKPRRDMSPQELEEHLIELRSKGLNTRGVLRSLLLSYCRRTKFTNDSENDETVKSAQKRVQEIIEQLVESGSEFSNAMYASIMEFHVNCGNIDAAVQARDQISDDFVLDAHKVFNFASLYVKNGNIEKAIDLIKQEKTRRSQSVKNEEEDDEEESKPVPLRYSDRSLNRLLNVIIDERKDAKLVKEVFELGLEYSGMPVTTIMAGPIIKVHVLNEDYSSALQEYVNCATNYRVLPWKTELMRVFLEKADPTSLQTVIDHSNTIHGEMNTILDLSVACIGVGKIKQAKKLIDTPGLRVKPERLENVCQRFIDDDKIEDLEQFVSITKNLFDVNRDLLFQQLIKGYVKSKSASKALNVWTLMQEENIQPSDRTLIFLADYLQKNNIAVPFAVPPKSITRSDNSSKVLRHEDKDQSSTNTAKEQPLNQLNSAIKRGDIDEALNIKQTLEEKGGSVLMTQNCSLIEALLNSDRTIEAYNLTQSLLRSKLFPSPRILRFLLSKLASNGDLQLIETLKPQLPDSIVQNNWFSNVLANAYVSAGKAEQFIDEVLPELKPFPLGGLLAVLSARADLEEPILKIANRMAQEEDYHLPLNMVWLHYMQNERYDDANQVYVSTPKFKEFLLFTSLLDKIRDNKNVGLAQKLIQTLLGSNLTSKSIGIAYSCLIDVFVDLGQIESAEELVLKDIISNTATRMDPKTGIELRIIDIEHINRSSLLRLINSIRDTEKREPKFSLPKKTLSSSNSSTEDSNGSSSSDDEAVGIKQK